MATIPSKQLHRVGDNDNLMENLSEREIGYSTDDSVGYIKLQGELFPLGGNGVPAPSSTSILVGDTDGGYQWIAGLVTSPYDSSQQMWASIGGKPILATASTNDSEGRYVSSSVYVEPLANPIYGALRVSADGVSGYSQVSIRKGNSDPSKSDSYVNLGGLLPRLQDSTTAGSVLSVVDADGSKGVSWVPVSVIPTKGSVAPLASGTAYNMLYLIDPGVHEDEPKVKVVTNPSTVYVVGHYYIIDNELYRCTESSTFTASFIEEDGIVSVLNSIVDRIQ